MVTDNSIAYKAFIGIDWADRKHDICLQSSSGSKREFSVLKHDVKAIDEWALGLYKKFKGPIAIAVELTKGPIVYALQKYDFIVLFPIDPTTLARYRSAFTTSCAKDDPTDEEFALDLMLRYPDRFKPLKPQSEDMRKLMYLVEYRRKLVEDNKRFGNRLIDTLKQYYPQILESFSHRNTELFLKFVIRWPSLQKIKRAREDTVRVFFSQNAHCAQRLTETRLKNIRDSSPLTEDQAVLFTHQLRATSIAEQMLVTIKAIRKFDKEIHDTFYSLPDAKLFDCLPGAGPKLAPRLLVAFGEQRDRYSSAQGMQQHAGIAPVTERSGKKEWVHWRWTCSTFLRQTFIEWADKTRHYSYWAGIYYQRQREKGNPHNVALRALAFKWIRILYSCWKTKTPYDESKYLNSLKRNGSPLLT